MQWSALVCLVVVIVCGLSVKSILVFSFCAIVSFILARNLLESEANLDFTKLLVPKRVLRNGCVIHKPFPHTIALCSRTAIRKILRDFVVSWYQNVGLGERFIVETQALLEEATDSLYERIARTSISSYTENLCIVLHKHLAVFQATKSHLAQNHKECQNSDVNTFVQMYQSLGEKPHHGQQNELEYLRTVVDLLLHRLVKKKSFDCDTGRFILREILAVGLFSPLIDFLLEPDFLNTSIINIFGGNSVEINQVIVCPESKESLDSNYKPNSTLMDCLEKETESQLTANSKSCRNPVEPSVKYKFKNAMVIEQDYDKHVEISMEERHDSENKPKALPNNPKASLNNEKENSISENSRLKLKTDTATFLESNEKPDVFTEEPTHSPSLKTDTNTVLDKPRSVEKLKVRNGKPSGDKENDSKLKAIFSVKIHPRGFLFSRNLKRFNTSPVIKQSEVKNMGNSFLETTSRNSFIVEEHSEQPRSRSASNNLDFDQSSLPADGNEEVEIQKCQSVKKSIPHSLCSRLGTCERGSTSSFEDIDVFDIPNFDEEDTEILNHEETKNDEGHQTNGFIAEQKETPVLRSEDECLQDKGPSRSCPSSAEDWDTVAFEAGGFVEGGDESSDATPGADLDGNQSAEISSLAEFAILEADNPSFMIGIPLTELIPDHSWEPHKSKYTVYHVVYNTKLWPQSDTDEDTSLKSVSTPEQSESAMQRSIKRRYREFMELHHRLCEGPYASYMEEIPKPNRKFNSPFFRFDQDVIEGRQLLLESYLKCLVTSSVILNCDDFKGFLGIGDENHTNFRRQIAVPSVPRIDKKLHKKVTKIIGQIKTAFETVDGDKEEEYEHIRQVLGEDKNSQDEEIRTFAICSGGCKPTHNCCYSGKYFQTYIQQKHEDGEVECLNASKGLEGIETERPQGVRTDQIYPPSDVLEQEESPPTHSVSKSKVLKRKKILVSNAVGDCKMEENEVHQSTFPLTETVLNLSCEVLQKQNSWLCLEPVQQAATAVFGSFFEWWFESLVSELITEEQWYHYLTLLVETIWPGGELMTSTKLERTKEEKEKSKEEAVQVLSDFFGGLLHAAIGTDALNASVSDIVESLQYPEINRQLLLEVLEVTLVEVFPDIITEKDLYLSTRSC